MALISVCERIAGGRDDRSAYANDEIMFIELDITKSGTIWPTTPVWPSILQTKLFTQSNSKLFFRPSWHYQWHSIVNGQPETAFFTFIVLDDKKEVSKDSNYLVFNEKNIERAREDVKKLFEEKAMYKGRFGNRAARRKASKNK